MTCLLTFPFLVSLLSQFWGNNETTLLFAGDAMQHKVQLECAYHAPGEYDYSDCFEALTPYISEADYAVVNLETPLGGKPYTGYPCFCAPDAFAQALQEAGFDMMLTANNHTLDRHDAGLRRTLQVLDDLGVDHLGTYADAKARLDALPLIKDINGIKIGFLNYTYGTNGFSPQKGAVVDYIDKQKIKHDIAQARDAGAELLCVAIHWGDEYHLYPNNSQKQTADFLVDEGVDLVIGGHPHVIQPMEIRYRDDGTKALVVYSLGNFISGMKTPDTRGGAMVKAYLSRDAISHKAQIDSASYKLVFTVPGVQGHSNFRLVDADSCDSKQWKTHCANFVQRAENVFNKANKDVPKEKPIASPVR